MKNISSILIMLVVVGCSKSLTEEDVFGQYEKRNADPYKSEHMILHGNGTVEEWEGTSKGSKESDHTKDWNWKVVEKEVHINVYKGDLLIFRAEPNGDLTKVALKSSNGKRLDIPDKAITKDSVWVKIKLTPDMQRYIKGGD